MFTIAPRPFLKWSKEKQSIRIFNKFDWCPQLSLLCLISGSRQLSIYFQAAAKRAAGRGNPETAELCSLSISHQHFTFFYPHLLLISIYI